MSGHNSSTSSLGHSGPEDVEGTSDHSSLLTKKRKLDNEADTQDSNGSWQNQAMDYHLPIADQCSSSNSRSVIYDATCSSECPISPESLSHSEDEPIGDGSLSSGLSNMCQPDDLRDWLATFRDWTNTERSCALEALIMSEICDIQQLRFLLSLIEPQLQRDFISLLPKELSLYVLSFLDPKDLLKAAQACRYWRVLCEDNLLWREKCKEDGLLEDHETIVSLFRKRLAKRRKSVTVPSRGSHSNGSPGSSSSSQAVSIPFTPSEYKMCYLRQKSIEFNWRYGKFPSDTEPISCPHLGRKGRYLKEVLQLKGHDDHVITCLQFNPASK